LASPCNAATLAAADASIVSFLRWPPRESSLTRAVAVEGTGVDLAVEQALYDADRVRGHEATQLGRGHRWYSTAARLVGLPVPAT
jgi:hypothetical protein